MSPDEPIPDAPYLWNVLRHYIEQTCIAFGLPASIARRIWLTRTHNQHLLDWLRPLEALLRRLIFLDAIALTPEPPPAPEHKTRAKRVMPAAFGAAFDPDNSETWRVNFNLGATADRRPPAGHAAKHTKPRLINSVASAPAALRLEALIRAFNEREKLALRLALKLQRNAQRIIIDTLTPPPRRIAAKPLWHSVIDAINLCRAAFAPALEPAPNTS